MRLFFFFFALPALLSAQTAINGRVIDPEAQPLAFVSILLDDQPGRGVLSDIEGRFTIGADAGAQFLTFRYIGYETRRVKIGDLNQHAGPLLEITLQVSTAQLPEAVITPGENPAERLIRLAIDRRDENNPEKRSAYRCKTYNKVVFEAISDRPAFEKTMEKRDTSKKEWKDRWDRFHKSERLRAQQNLFLMESVTERLFKFPSVVQERVLLNRVSGLESVGLVALANMVQPFSCYGDYFKILDKEFVNPISPGSPKLYLFNIEDTLFEGSDTIWIIQFRPRKGRIFDGLEGVIYLNSNGWAVQNLRTQPADPHAKLHVKIEQAYRRVQGKWFPEQLNFEIGIEKYPSPLTGIRAAGRSYVDDAEIEIALGKHDFDPEMPLILLSSAFNRSDSAWQRWHDLAPLSAQELRTYSFMDSIGKRKKLDFIARLLDYSVTGLAPLHPNLSVELPRILRFNNFEGVRIGAGLSTAQHRPLQPPRRVEMAAWTGYGIRDKAWKYGANGTWRISRASQTQLRVSWSQDLREPGTLYELRPATVVNRTLFANRMDYVTEWMAAVASRPQQAFTLQMAIRQQDIRPSYNYQFLAEDGIARNRFTFREGTIYLRLAKSEQVQRMLGNDFSILQPWPVVEFGYTRGWGDYQYQRWALAVYQSVMVRRLGSATWRLEAGQVSAGVPLAKLFMLNQGGGSFGALAINGVFQALPDTLFVSDRFVNLYLSQEVGHIFYRTKYSAPFLTVLHNTAWGNLKQIERHQGVGFAVANRPYLESGIRLDHVLQFNYVNICRIGLGGAFFYRWGNLRSPDWQKNVALRFVVRLTM